MVSQYVLITEIFPQTATIGGFGGRNLPRKIKQKEYDKSNKISPPIHLHTYEALCQYALTLTIVLLAILKITVYTNLDRVQ